MDRMVFAIINGEKRPLNYSVEVMFDAVDKFGNITTLLQLLDKDDREAFEAVKWMIIHMANDAELCRRAEGYDRSDMLVDDSITPHIKVVDFLNLKNSVAEALAVGYGREIEDPKTEIDLGLQELQSKKVKAKG